MSVHQNTGWELWGTAITFTSSVYIFCFLTIFFAWLWSIFLGCQRSFVNDVDSKANSLWETHQLSVCLNTTQFPWMSIVKTWKNPNIYKNTQGLYTRETMMECVCTWLASSLVGEMITALKPRFAGCCRWASSGRQNANVFPDPVGAQARSSRPWDKNKCHKKSTACVLYTK